MITFRFKWKLGDEVFVGEKVCADEAVLRVHVKNLGGELIEILESKEIVEIKPAPAETKITSDSKVPEEPTLPAKREPSIGIILFGWYYILRTNIDLILALYLHYFKGVNPNISNRISAIPNEWGAHLTFPVLIFISVIPAVVGVGLLLLQKWSRILALVEAWFYVTISIYALFFLRINVPIFSIFVIWFFSRYRIRRQFNAR